MKKIKYLPILLLVLFSSCKTISIEEFKKTYDWIVVDSEFTDYCYGTSDCYQFVYNNMNYTIVYSGFPDRPIGTKYKILIDKESPDENFIFLLDKEIKPTSQYKRISADLLKVKQIDNNYAYIKYSFHAIYDNGMPFSGSKEKNIVEYSAISLNLLPKFIELHGNNKKVIIDMYIINDNGATYDIRPFINFEESLKQLQDCNAHNKKK